MKTFAARLVVGLALVASSTVHADDFFGITTISDTMGNNLNRLCVGGGDTARLDLGCPSNAPYWDAANGRLGIGTSNLLSTLDVSGTATISTAEANVSATLLSLQNNSLSATPGASLAFQVLNSNSGATLTYQHYSGNLVYYLGTKEWSSTSPIIPRYGIYHPAGGDVYQYWARDDGQEAMRLDHNGLVGIGETDPQTKLEVAGTISATNFEGDGSRLTNLPGGTGDRITSGTTNITAYEDASLTFTTAGTQRMVIDENGSVALGHEDDPVFSVDIRGQTDVALGASGGGNALYSNGATTLLKAANSIIFQIPNGTNHTTINSTGLGIGTTTPANTLDVRGTARVVGNAEVSGTVKIAGTGDETCGPSNLGTMRYNKALSRFELCVE